MNSNLIRKVIEKVEQDAPKQEILSDLQHLLHGAERDEEEEREERETGFEYTLKSAREELKQRFSEEVEGIDTDDLWDIDRYELLHEVADSNVPVYTRDIFICASHPRVFGRDDIEVESGESIDDILRVAIYESLYEELSGEYDWLLEEEKERREEAEEESEDDEDE